MAVTLTTTATQVAIVTSNTIAVRLYAWYEGSSSPRTVHLRMDAMSQGITYTGQNKDYQLVLGSVDTGTVTWSDAPLNADTWYTVREITASVADGGTVSARGKVWTYVYDDVFCPGPSSTDFVDLLVPATTVAPDTPTISRVSATDSSVTVSYGTTSFGTPSTGTVYLPCLYINTPSGVFTDSYSVASKTSTGLSNATIARYYRPPLSYAMQNNSVYYVAAYAKNDGDATARSGILAVYTCASAPTVSLDSVTDASATIAYTTVAGGGAYAQDIQYSLDGGTTWVAGATVASGTTAATSGTYTITGLSAGTTYTIQTRVSTPAGTTTGSTVTATTDAPTVNAAFYGSVNGVSKKVAKLYGSVNGQTKLIKKLYGSVNGVTKLVYEA